MVGTCSRCSTKDIKVVELRDHGSGMQGKVCSDCWIDLFGRLDAEYG